MDDSAERRFLEKGLHSMQRRSGPLQTIPDDYVITSLEVVIHEHERLGAGGFGQVFRADWRGTVVAVKVMDQNVPPRVRSSLHISWCIAQTNL